MGRTELAPPSGSDSAKVQRLGDFSQFAQPRLFHHFRDHLAESSVSVGGNLLADFNRFGNGGLILRVSQFDPTTFGRVQGEFGPTGNHVALVLRDGHQNVNCLLYTSPSPRDS